MDFAALGHDVSRSSILLYSIRGIMIKELGMFEKERVLFEIHQGVGGITVEIAHESRKTPAPSRVVNPVTPVHLNARWHGI
jgi:hypothetical protein